MPNYAETYIQTIGTKFNPNNLTSCSNALTCLTDLIIAHPYLAPNYARDVIVMAINKINLNNVRYLIYFSYRLCTGSISPEFMPGWAMFVLPTVHSFCLTI